MAQKDRKKKARPAREPVRSRAVPGALRLPGAGVRRWLGIGLGLLLVLAVLYPGPLFSGKVFRSSDSQNADAFAVVGDRSLAAGDYPQWNPYLFAGMPSFGSLAYAKYLYPPSVVLNFLQQKLGFVPLTWLLAHLLFGGLGMAWLLSRWRLPAGALLLGAVIWLMAPKVVAWSVHGHGTKLGAAMYLPWIVAWAWRVLDGRGARAIGMTGLLLGLQLLRGHVQITYYTLALVAWLALFHGVWPLEEAARRVAARVRWLRVGQLAAGLALGFVIGAILLVPVHGYSGISIRGQDTAGGGGVGLDYATGWSLAPSELSTLLFPGAAGFGGATYLGAMPFNDYPNYMGLLVLALAALAWWPSGKRLVIALGALVFLVLLVSFGKHGPGLYELLYHWLPFFNKFRIPSMILILVYFVLALLAPLGATAWMRGAAPGGKPGLWPGILMALGAICLLGGATSLAHGPFTAGVQHLAQIAGRETPQVLADEAWSLHRSSLVRIGLILLVAGSAMMASLKQPLLRSGALIWILVALVGLDLFSVDRLITGPDRGLLQVGRDSTGRTVLVNAQPLEAEFRRTESGGVDEQGRALAEVTGHQRVYPLGMQARQNTWMTAEVRSLGGYHPAKLAAYEPIRRRLFSERPAGRLADWLGGSVVTIEGALREQDFATLESLGVVADRKPLLTGPLYAYRNEAALPRARLVTRWEPVSDLPEKDALEPFLDGIQGGSIPITDRVRLAEAPVPEPEPAAGPLPVPRFVTDGLDEVVLETDSPAAALLLLADMFAPGWSVEVDGESKPLLRADLVLRAVALEAGTHTVRFHYFDPTVRTGLLFSLAGGLLAFLLIAVPFFRRPASAPTPGGESDPGEKAAHDD